MIRSAVWHPLARARPCETAFRRDHEPFRIRIKGFGDEQFACIRTICIGGINQIHAKIGRASENFQRVLSIGGPTPNALPGDAHRAETKSIDSEVTAQIERRIYSHV